MVIKIKDEVKEDALKLLGFEKTTIKRTAITHCGDEKKYNTAVHIEYNYVVNNYTIAIIYPDKTLDLHTYDDMYVFELAELIYKMSELKMLEFSPRGLEG